MLLPRRTLLAFGCLFGLIAGVLSPWSVAAAADPQLRFESDVRLIFKTHCFHCHGEEEDVAGGLDLRLVRWMAEGGDSGPAIEPGNSAASLIWERIEAGEMPPEGKGLSDKERAAVARWIDQGAQTVRPEPENLDEVAPWTEEERNHWSLQPVERPEVPQVAAVEMVDTPIDAFLLATLEEHSLQFAAEADRRTLLRRLSFDLVGLPPSPEMVEQFATDPSPDAYERIVDRLLASPAYGERWGRHWLDVAGYADSDGYTEKDMPRPWAFRYRDYVIDSFNKDKSLDQFIVEQLAGDELVKPPYQDLTPEDAEKLTATGFLRMAPDGTGDPGVDANVARNDVVAETIKIVSSSMMGLTVGCAQCHNHRYDPISHVDYHRFRAIFEPALDWKNWRNKRARLVSLWQPAQRELAAEVDKELAEVSRKRLEELDAIVNEIFEAKVAELSEEQQAVARAAREAPADKRTPEQVALLKEHPSLNVSRGSAYLYDRKRLADFNKRYDKLQEEVRARRPADSYVACLTEVPGKVPETRVFLRGDINQPGEAVTPGVLSVLPNQSEIPADDPELPTTGRRLAFAKHLTSGEHPLVARALVNRVWMHHFGRGIAATPGDLGILGEPPTHPELLDFLADELVRGGWQLKPLHRMIVLSRAYRQDSRGSDAAHAADPENRWLGRMSVRRLESEAIRDAMIEVAGTRVGQMHGPPAEVNPDEMGETIIGEAARDGNGILVAKFQESAEQYRRSIYIQIRRSMPLGVLEPFDMASVTPNCDRRTSSTVAPQALLMMNNSYVVLLSEKFAQRVVREAGSDPAAQARHAWQLAFGRPATEAETAAAVELIAQQREYFEQHPAEDTSASASTASVGSLAAPEQALALFCQALMSSNRFLYVD